MNALRFARFRSREDKLAAVARLFAQYLSGDVLDVGCDVRTLSRWVRGRYVGVDLGGHPDVRVNLEEGLPFQDRAFDVVVAMDVLEHVDRLHAVFDEVCRVSRWGVIIGLPNLLEWRFRWQFLVGRGIGGKYGLPAVPPADRHRWLFGLGDARRLVAARGTRNGFAVADEVFAYYDYHHPAARGIEAVGRAFAPRLAGFFAYHYWAALRRTS